MSATNVPYKGTGEALQGVVGDQVQFMGGSLGMAAFMDPLLTNPNTGTQDVLFTANNAGKVAKFTWNSRPSRYSVPAWNTPRFFHSGMYL